MIIEFLHKTVDDLLVHILRQLQLVQATVQTLKVVAIASGLNGFEFIPVIGGHSVRPQITAVMVVVMEPPVFVRHLALFPAGHGKGAYQQ